MKPMTVERGAADFSIFQQKESFKGSILLENISIVTEHWLADMLPLDSQSKLKLKMSVLIKRETKKKTDENQQEQEKVAKVNKWKLAYGIELGMPTQDALENIRI